jgi:hypothetical protein
MVANVGTADRLFRIVVGVVLVVAPFVTATGLLAEPAARLVLPVLGAVLIITALFRFCPLYRIFGLRTCRTG